MLNIVVPMAGRGSRFAEKGYSLPKPLIPVFGVPMIKVVIENIRPTTPHRFIFICQEEHIRSYQLDTHLKEWSPGCSVIPIDRITEGAACTVLLSREIINNHDPLMIANCDQFVDISIDDYLQNMSSRSLDGLIMTMKANHPKWSYVGFDKTGRVNRVVEKEVISDEATVGIYNFRKGSDFVRGAEEMISQNLRVNNEFYVAPVYNQSITKGANLGVYSIGTEGNGMYGLGIPEDLEKFESLNTMARRIKG